jgi:mycofactocin precursor
MDDATDVTGLHIARADDAGGEDAILEEDLVEEISIDGMCGVY